MADSGGRSSSVDYPLRVRLEGTLPDGTRPCRRGRYPGFRRFSTSGCGVDAEHGSYPGDAQPAALCPPTKAAEYEGL